MIDFMDMLLVNGKTASYFFILLLLVRPLTDKYFSQSWHYITYRVNLLLFFLPIQWLSESVVAVLVKVFPKTKEITDSIAKQYMVTPIWDFLLMEDMVGEIRQNTVMNSLKWDEIIFTVWFVMGICLLLWQWYCRVRLHNEVKEYFTVHCPIILNLFQKCKDLIGVTCSVPILGSNTIYSPVLLGVFSPKIVLPLERVKEEHLEYIFNHELTHYKRKDLWWKLLLTLLNILFWWNPLIYLFSYQFETVLEYSCDEEVVRLRNREERKCYGQAILESIDEQQTTLVLGVSFSSPEQKLERRLMKMLKFNEMKNSTKLFSGALMIAILLGTVTPSVVSAMKSEEGIQNSEIISTNVETQTVVEEEGVNKLNTLMAELEGFGIMYHELTALLNNDESVEVGSSITWDTATGMLNVNSEKDSVLHMIASQYEDRVGVVTSDLLAGGSISYIIGIASDGTKFLYTNDEFLAYISGMPKSDNPDDIVKEYEVPQWLEDAYYTSEIQLDERDNIN